MLQQGVIKKPQQEEEDWRASKGIIQRNRYIFENSLWSDCTFMVNNGEEPQQIFQCHTYILASASCVFERMFFGPLKETDIITVTDIAPKTFKLMLQYIYSEELPNSSFEDILSLGMAANKYMLMDLLEWCGNKMESLLGPGIAIPALEFAKCTHCNHLMNSAMEKIKTETKTVLKSESFLKAEPGTIRAILEENDLNGTPEKIMWDAILEWAKHQCSIKGLPTTDEQLREVLEPFLPFCRFLTMTCEEFAEGPASSDILGNKECKAILMHIASPEVSIQFPTGFSRSRSKRVSPVLTNIQETIASNSVEIKFSLTKPLKISGFKFLCQPPFCIRPNNSLKVEVMKDLSTENSQRKMFGRPNMSSRDMSGRPNMSSREYACSVIQMQELSSKNEYDFDTGSVKFNANDDVKIILSFTQWPYTGFPAHDSSSRFRISQSVYVNTPKSVGAYSEIYWLDNTKYFLAIFS